MSKGKRDERKARSSNPSSDGAGGPQAPEPSTSGSPSPQQNNAPRPYFEALVGRIVDVYAAFTPDEMEMVEALGWGLGKPKSGG